MSEISEGRIQELIDWWGTSGMAKLIYNHQHQGGGIIPTDRDNGYQAGIDPQKVQPAETSGIQRLTQILVPNTKSVRIRMDFCIYGDVIGQVIIERESYTFARVQVLLDGEYFSCPFQLDKHGTSPGAGTPGLVVGRTTPNRKFQEMGVPSSSGEHPVLQRLPQYPSN